MVVAENSFWYCHNQTTDPNPNPDRIPNRKLSLLEMAENGGPSEWRTDTNTAISRQNEMRMHDFVELDYRDVNLALNKPASQSSTYMTSYASYAVDGHQQTVSCTLGNVHPWLSVDLAAEYDVGYVTVSNDHNDPVGNYRRN